MIKKLVINGLLFMLLAQLLPGIMVSGLWGAIWSAVVYSLLMAVVGGVLKFITIPLNFVTFGLVGLVINGFILYLTSGLSSGLHISSFFSAIIASIVLSMLQGLMFPKVKIKA